MQHYTIEATLSQAQDGIILLCRDQNTAEHCVLKRTPIDLPASSVELAAYMLLRASNSAHILRLFHAFQDKQHQHLVLDYCARGELYQVLKTLPQQHCSPADARAYFRQIAAGVAHIHAHHLAHRDLSLENIFVDAQGILKIGDFGLAMPLAGHSRTAVGKSYYMAPEMHAAGGYSAAKVDVWSLGILLWMLLTGVPLVEASNDSDETFVYLKRFGLRCLLGVWRVELPDDAVKMLELLLVVDPAARPDMTAVLQHPYTIYGRGLPIAAAFLNFPFAMDAYAVDRIIAPAIYGQILLCTHKATKTKVVIKRLDAKTVVKSPTIHESIGMEKLTYDTLYHAPKSGDGRQFVLGLLDTFQEDGCDHLVLEYCPGGELFDALKASPNGRFDPLAAQRYFGQIVRGLRYLHNNGFAHRDISLENVLLDKNGDCKLCDFGLAVQVPVKNLEFAAVGKTYYMAPEMYTGGGYDPVQVDVWCLGILLFMMHTGLPLLERARDDNTIFQYVKQYGVYGVIRSWQLDALLPPMALDLLEALLTVDPTRRITLDMVCQHPYLLAPTSHTQYIIKQMDTRIVEEDTDGATNGIEKELQAYAVIGTALKATDKTGGRAIVTLVDSFTEDGWVHLVLEFCAQGDLFEMLQNSPRELFYWDDAQRYFDQIAHGVAFLHTECGLAHRDISLENVLVDEFGDCKLCDFGLASLDTKRETRPVGKRYYMAPEMYGNDGYDPKQADVWALGVLLYMMHTGLPLVEKAAVTDRIFNYIQTHGLAAMVKAWRVQRLLPQQALDLLEKMLVINPAERISITDVLQHSYVTAPLFA
ncbi:protein kinase [Achlya hypogyna]|uniref:Protein kinase n=1 Tax=Achlya hypogyna TaxID=1202772 RepID=A0A1V9YSU7_ACHHY|nr:protein kinase [Achlya hypogyna]